MAPIIIDLLSDSEDGESHCKSATRTLQDFQPRKERPSRPASSEAAPNLANILQAETTSRKIQVGPADESNQPQVRPFRCNGPRRIDKPVPRGRPQDAQTATVPGLMGAQHQPEPRRGSRFARGIATKALKDVRGNQESQAHHGRPAEVDWRGDSAGIDGTVVYTEMVRSVPMNDGHSVPAHHLRLFRSNVLVASPSSNAIIQRMSKSTGKILPPPPDHHSVASSTSEWEEPPPPKRQRLGRHGVKPTARCSERSLSTSSESGDDTSPATTPPPRTTSSPPLEAQKKGHGSVIRPPQSVGRVPTQPVLGAKPKNSGAAGSRYTEEDDALLARLKEVEHLSWDAILGYFPGRSKGSLQVHYSTNVKGCHDNAAKQATLPRPPVRQMSRPPKEQQDMAAAEAANMKDIDRQRPKRLLAMSITKSFVSRSLVNHSRVEETAAVEFDSPKSTAQAYEAISVAIRSRSRASLSRILRRRELGMTGAYTWQQSAKGLCDELKQESLKCYALQNYYMVTSGDVNCLAWASDSPRFAAGSVAITDERSMQYNSGFNLLLGNAETGILQELPEHYMPRPIITTESNVNASHAMRESQDSRLFATISALKFSDEGHRLYSAGADKKFRVYALDNPYARAECIQVVDHPDRVDLLDISRDAVVATACHISSNNSIRIYRDGDGKLEHALSLSADAKGLHSGPPVFPSALKWSMAHRNFLLAGFASDSQDQERDTAGETALWDVETGRRIKLSTSTHYVFDVAWNPAPGSGSLAFCVASTPGFGKSSANRRSVVQCYAPSQAGAKQVLEWDCPAFDINDVLFCPFDDNLIAAGATSGKVYVWDKRFAVRGQGPLHVFGHGESLNVLDHDRSRELADTGVRFLSWGATGSRLYSGSSDGVVKVWDPYRSTADAHIDDVACFETAVMSGSFSGDYRSLLVGEERGRINLLVVDSDDKDGVVCAARSFKIEAASMESSSEPYSAAANRLLRTKQIELRPMGSLPVRQAVRGPAYNGPYFQPTVADWTAAENTYQKALHQQYASHFNSIQQSPSSQAAEGPSAVEQQLQEAQSTLQRLRFMEDEYTQLEHAAAALQRGFRAQRKNRLSLEDPMEACKLDCNFLPPYVDPENGVPDSHRSEQRIPGAMRSLPTRPIDVAELNCRELFEFGLAGTCPHCAKRAEHPSTARMLNILCRQRCAGIWAGITGSCEICSAPVRIAQQNRDRRPAEQRDAAEGISVRCERCKFTCFRCERPVQLLSGPGKREYSIYCSACDMVWAVGVLGFEPIPDMPWRESIPEKSLHHQPHRV